MLERAIMEMVMALVADVKERTMMQILMEMMVRPMMVKAVKTKMTMNDGDCDDGGGGDVDGEGDDDGDGGEGDDGNGSGD